MTRLRQLMASAVMTAPPAGTVMASLAPTSTTVPEVRAETAASAATRAPTSTSVTAPATSCSAMGRACLSLRAARCRLRRAWEALLGDDGEEEEDDDDS